MAAFHNTWYITAWFQEDDPNNKLRKLLRAKVMAMQIKRAVKIQTSCGCIGVLPSFRVELNPTSLTMEAVAAVVQSAPEAQLV